MGIALFIVVGLLVSWAFLVRTRWHMRMDPEPQPDYRPAAFDAFKDMVLAALLFGVIGPLVGVLAYTVFALSGDTDSESISMGAVVFLAFFAYLLGGIPALATGALAGGLRHRLHGWRGVVATALLGALMVWLLWSAGMVFRGDWHGDWQRQAVDVLQMAALFGLPAGALCGWLYLRSGSDT